jgi:3-dehydroquinate dehydratase I
MKYQTIVTLGEAEIANVQNTEIDPVDILEIRLDLISKPFLQNKLISILNRLNKQILFTYRLPEDSSVKNQTQHSRIDLDEVLNTFNFPTNYLDIDLKASNQVFQDYKNLKYKPIYSLHNFDGIYSKEEILDHIKTISDDNGIFKFAVLPSSFEDGIHFLQTIKDLSKQYSLVGIWMGESGQFSRIFGDLFGSQFTYASLNEPKAPGQMNVKYIEKLRKVAGLYI